jgi:hypothetical protein
VLGGQILNKEALFSNLAWFAEVAKDRNSIKLLYKKKDETEHT